MKYKVEPKLEPNVPAEGGVVLSVFLGIMVVITIIAFSCGCSPSPLTPTELPPQHMIVFWDDPQPEGWTSDSTYMTYKELCIYFAAHYTDALCPPDAPERCFIYNWFLMNWFPVDAEPGSEAWANAYKLVRWYEKYRCDVPYYIDVEAPC